MTTFQFITLLRENPSKKLTFQYDSARYVREDFHLTEVKNVSFSSVDCGGQVNNWTEVHIQLWESPDFQADHRLDTTKALSIIERCHRINAMPLHDELKVEYGNSDFHTAVMPIRHVDIHEKELVIALYGEATQCKAQDRARLPQAKESCCSDRAACC